MSELLTVEEVAEKLRIGERTVWRFIRAGDIPSVKVGRRRFVTPDGLEAYMRLAARRGRVM